MHIPCPEEIAAHFGGRCGEFCPGNQWVAAAPQCDPLQGGAGLLGGSCRRSTIRMRVANARLSQYPHVWRLILSYTKIVFCCILLRPSKNKNKLFALMKIRQLKTPLILDDCAHWNTTWYCILGFRWREKKNLFRESISNVYHLADCAKTEKV